MPHVLEFSISIVVIFLLLSMVVSGLTEYWSSRIGKNSRSSLLFESLLKVFNDPLNRNFTEAIYRHPLVENSKPTENNLPAYLDSKIIAQVLIEVIIRDQIPYQIRYDSDGRPIVEDPTLAPDDTFQLFKNSVSQLHSSDLKIMLLSFIHGSDSLEVLKSKIETWYNTYMDRVSGWYKKRMKTPLFFTALLVTIFMNADLFRISKAVWVDDDLRKALVEQAVELSKDSALVAQMKGKTVEKQKQMADSIYDDLKLKNLPLGWISEVPDTKELPETKVSKSAKKSTAKEKLSFINQLKEKIKELQCLIEVNFKEYGSFSTILGWILMAFALHMGAPFWFDTLVKLINIRGAGVKPGK